MNPIPGAAEESDNGSYRPISSLAVAAAAAGVLSVACLVSPVAWVVPPVAIALAVAALREIGREGSVKVGRIPAVLGLALAVGFGTQSVSYRAVSDWFVRARAATAAREFVRAARESRFADARDMCSPTAGGLRDGAGVAVPDGPPPASAFASLPAVALLARCSGFAEKMGSGSAEATMAVEPPPEDFPAAHAFVVTVPCRPLDGRAEARDARVRVVVQRGDQPDRGTGFERWQVVWHEVVSPIGRPVQ